MKANEDHYQAGLAKLNRTMKYDGIQRVQWLSQLVAALVSKAPRQTVIRVCGTNGKGSIATLVSNILQQSGQRVGLFTSPYLIDPREQVQINGRIISAAQFLQAEQMVQNLVEKMGYHFKTDVSEFEAWFLIAIQVFITQATDVMVLECGMGGQLDATNAIDHSDFSLFALIGLDHFKFLGTTIEQIATTKAKMIRDHEQVISYPQQRPVVDRILHAVAATHAADVHVANTVQLQVVDSAPSTATWHLRALVGQQSLPLTLNMGGAFQLANLQTVLEWWQVYNQHQLNPISITALQAGVAQTHLTGRFSRLPNGWIVDGAHNRDAINAFVASVNAAFPTTPKLIMVGFLADKEVQRCVHELQGLTNVKFVTVTPANHDRCLSSAALFQVFQNESRIQSGVNQVVNADTFDNAVAIFNAAAPQMPKLIVGSFYTVRGIIELLNEGNYQDENSRSTDAKPK